MRKYLILTVAAMTILCAACGSKSNVEKGVADEKSSVLSSVSGDVLQDAWQGMSNDLQNDSRLAMQNSIQDGTNDTKNISDNDTQKNGETGNDIANSNTGLINQKMVMLDDKLYVDTGEISYSLRCGMMDFDFDSSVESGIPTKNFQTNFGIGYNGQYGMRENRIEIEIDNQWHIFAYNENNLSGVSMKVIDSSKEKVTIEITDNSGSEDEYVYGEECRLEKYNEQNQTWEIVPYISDEIGFIEIAYIIGKNQANKFTQDLKTIYGDLQEGRYRLIKKIYAHEMYTYMAEFEL